MKGKPFRDQDNRALHERRMKERTRIVVTQKNIEYILAHHTIPEKNLLATYGNAKKSWDTSQLSLRLSAAIYWRFDLAPGQRP